MKLKHCSKEAYAMCPMQAYCGPQEGACYVPGSKCDKYNETIDFLVNLRKAERKEATGDV